MSKFGEEWTRGFRDMMIEAGSRAVEDGNLHGEEIDGTLRGHDGAGHASSGRSTSARLWPTSWA